MNIKVISRNVGYALLVSALFMFLSILVSVANGNDSALAALMISFALTFTVGIFPFIFVRKTTAISLKDGYMIIVLSWLLSFVFGMLPYALWGGPFTIVNAWFESVSGFTTTGASILGDVESLPNSLLFWRSSTHFIGGLGVVIFLLLIIPSSSQMKLRLTNLELSSLSKREYRSGSSRTVYIFTYVYFGMAVASFLMYLLAGMSPFDAINHAMSVTATGGFSTKNLSIGSFNSVPIDLITMFFMLLSSVHLGGYSVAGCVSREELMGYDVDMDGGFRMGVFRADFRPDGSVNWYSLKETDDRKADFHQPSVFFDARICRDGFFREKGIVLSVQDLGTMDWPSVALANGINTIGTHMKPAEVMEFIGSDAGKAFMAKCGELGTPEGTSSSRCPPCLISGRLRLSLQGNSVSWSLPFRCPLLTCKFTKNVRYSHHSCAYF